MYKITAPVKGYSGEGYGLRFVGSVAETERADVAEYLRGKGYTVEAPEPPEKTKETKEPKKPDGDEPPKE